MADIIEYEEGYDLGGSSSDDTNPPLTFRQDAQNLIDIVEAQGMTYQDNVDSIKALDLTYCPKYAYCFANDKLYEYDATSTAAADDVDVLLPSSSVGRWLTARDFSTSVAVTQQYVDDQDILLATQLGAYVDARCENGAQVNTIESISVNTVDVAPNGNKNVDITVPENTSELVNDSNFVVDATYVHTDNNYTNAEKSKLSGIDATAQVNVIETVKVNGTALSVVNKAVDITTTTGDTGDSAYEVAVDEGYNGSQAEWVASLQGADGTLWKYTAEALVIGSDVIVGDLVEPFAVNDLVISTDNSVWGIIKSIAGTDAIVTGLAAGGANGQDGSAIFFGTAVTGTGTGISAVVAGSKTGDYYKNTTTSYFYQATDVDTWDYKGTDKGDRGDDGADGATWLSGAGTPTTEGVNGDFYYREETGDIYKKIGGSWILIDNIKGLTGDDGADGATWISGTADPTTEGANGDYYLRTTDYEIYKKTSGSWNSIGNIKGVDGVVDPTTISTLPSALTDTDKILVIRNNTVYFETAVNVKTYTMI